METKFVQTDSDGMGTPENPYLYKSSDGPAYDWYGETDLQYKKRVDGYREFNEAHPPLPTYSQNNDLIRNDRVEVTLEHAETFDHYRQVSIKEETKPLFTHRAFNKMNFTEFQVQLRCCLIIKDGFDNEWMQDFYAYFTEDYKAGRYDTVKEWADDLFQELTLDIHSYCLVSKASDAHHVKGGISKANQLDQAKSIKNAYNILKGLGVPDLSMCRSLDCKVDINYTTLVKAMRAYHAQFANSNMAEGWISVKDSKPDIEKYYQLACNDDVYLDVFNYRPHGIDGNTGDYYRSVNDNSTLADHEVTHFKEFNTDPPNWTGL